MTDDIQSSGTVETKEQETTSTEKHVCLWLEAIALASKTEKPWRKKAKKCYDIYAAGAEEEEKKKPRTFNILYSNTQTLAPAIYNSPPVPDIRKRFGDADPEAKNVAQSLERAVGYSIDNYDFDPVIKAVVLDSCLSGRGVPRLRYEPTLVTNPVLQDPMKLQAAYSQAAMTNPMLTPEEFQSTIPPQVLGQQKASCEIVQWDDFRHGPAKVWKDVPWVAYRHLMTREQLVQLNPQIGPFVQLDQCVNGADEDKSKQLPDLFKRAIVWEVWDKESGEKLFVAESYKKDFLSRGKPEFNLDGFFPTPRPMYAVFSSTSLTPTIPYNLYESFADELNDVSKRIGKLIKALRWRGVSVNDLDITNKLKDAEDGEIVPADNTTQFMAAGKGIDDAIWFMPVDRLIVVLESLYKQREQIKQSIYEITGIADILRGASKATETLGAQQIKAQWGSLRIADMQKEAERISRDLIRMMVEVFAEKFEPEILALMTGIQLQPQEVDLMRNDVLRTYRIDVETDSTIRGDISRTQQNITQFVEGFGGFVQSIGPAVQSGMFPLPVAVDLLTAFSRAFKLGRQAEDALENLKQTAEQQAAQQQQAMTVPMGQPPIQQGVPAQQPKPMMMAR